MNQQSRLLEEGLAMYRGVSEKIDKFLEQEEAKMAKEAMRPVRSLHRQFK